VTFQNDSGAFQAAPWIQSAWTRTFACLHHHSGVDVSYLTRVFLALLLPAWAFATAAQAATSPGPSDIHWVASWGAAPDSPGRAFQAQTVRQVVRLSIGGAQIRIRLSNLFGEGPVTIGPVHAALHASGPAIEPGTDHAVTFGGKPTVTIAKGKDVLSDPVPLVVKPLQELAISVYLPMQTGPSTMHNTAIQTAFIVPGDATVATSLPSAEPDATRYFLTDVEVAATAQSRLIVAVGDSITDGVGSTDDRNARWPDALAARLQADPALASVAVVNSGISGNRILNDGFDPFIGPSVLSRFDRDALDKPGVRWVLLLSGTNDISAANALPRPQDKVSAQQIIEGMKTLIARAHARGIRIWGATLSPRAGTRPPFYTEKGEAQRREVNEWIRNSGAFDAVIDFEKVLRDPARPDALRPEFDSGDHLHPNDAGFRAMAESIDLGLFRRQP
jgi:lysophospholipase L1-like esterase